MESISILRIKRFGNKSVFFVESALVESCLADVMDHNECCLLFCQKTQLLLYMTRCEVTISGIITCGLGNVSVSLSKNISKTCAILTYIVTLHLCPKSEDAGFKCCPVEHFLKLFIIME
jgi:hypothetical protein